MTKQTLWHRLKVLVAAVLSVSGAGFIFLLVESAHVSKDESARWSKIVEERQAAKERQAANLRELRMKSRRENDARWAAYAANGFKVDPGPREEPSDHQSDFDPVAEALRKLHFEQVAGDAVVLDQLVGKTRRKK